MKNETQIPIKSLIRRDLRDIEPYSSARDEYSGSAAVFLDANENPYESGVNRYPDPYQSVLKSKLAEIKNIEVEKLILGNGSDEIIDLLFRGFCNPNEDFAVTIAPSYGMYDVSAKINGVRLEKGLLNEDFSLNLSAMHQQIQGAKLVFICSPNNPSGNSFSRTAIIELLNVFDGIVVVDEAYIDFSDEPSMTNLVNDFPRLFILQTLSKAWGLAGIRLGIGMGSAEIINFLNKIKPPYNINTLTQDYALRALENQQRVHEQIQIIKAERKKLSTFLSNLAVVEKVFPSDANFILVRIAGANSWYQKLLNHGIIVRNRSNQALCADTLRISIGTPQENQELMKIFSQLTQNQK